MSKKSKSRVLILVGVLAGLALLGGGGLAARKAHIAFSIKSALREGLAAEQAQEYPKAIEKLSYFCAHDRTNGKALLAFARARLQVPMENAEHLVSSMAICRAAAEVMPDDPEPLQLLLDLYKRAGFVTERLEVAEQVLKLAPGDRGALEARAVALAQVGRSAEALNASMEFASKFPGEIVAHRLVVALLSKADASKERLRRYIDEAAAAAPADPRIIVLQSEVAGAVGDSGACIHLARSAAQLPLKDVETVNEVVGLLDRLASMEPSFADLAEKILADQMKTERSAELAPIAAERAWKAGLSDRAREYVRSAVEQRGMDQASERLLGWFLILGPAPSDPPERTSAVRAQLQTRRSAEGKFWNDLVTYQEAIDKGDLAGRRGALELAGQSPEASSDLVPYFTGELEAKTGEWRAASERWRELIQRNPSWHVLRVSLASLLLQHNQYAEASRLAQASVRRHLSRHEALVFGSSLISLAETGAAEPEQIAMGLAIAEDLEKQFPQDPWVLLLDGRAQWVAGRAQKAAEVSSRLLQSDAPPEVLLQLAKACAASNPEAAGALRNRARALAPDDGAVMLATANSLADAGRLEEGKKLLADAVQAAAPGAARLACELRMAQFLQERNDPTASAYLAGVSKKYPGEPGAQVALLDSGVARTDMQATADAIGRLREIAGESSTGWRIYQARWLLVFTPSEARAAEAAKLMGTLLRDNQHNIEARVLWAEALMQLKDRDGAIKQLSAAIESDAGAVGLYPRLISLLRDVGRDEEASHRLMVFARAPQVAPALRRERARMLASQGLWDQAVADYSALLPLGVLEDRYGLALVLQRAGDVPGATSQFEQVLKTPGVTELMATAAAEFYAAHDQPERAEAVFDVAPPDATPERRDMLRASHLERHGKAVQAEAIYVKMARSGGAEPLAELARFYAKLGRMEEAQRTIDRARAVDPKNPNVLKIGGLIRLMTSGSTPEAMAEIAAGVEGRQESASMIQLTRALQELDKAPTDVESFISKLSQITTEDPGFFQAWRLLTEVYWRRGQMEQALQTAQSAVKALPTSLRAAQMLTEVLVGAGQPQRALGAARRWHELAVVDPYESELAIASLQAGLGSSTEALRLIEHWASRIIADADSAPNRIELYARLLAENSRPQEAHDLLWDRASRTRDWTLLYLRVGVSLTDLDESRRWVGRVEPLLGADGLGKVALGQAWSSIALRSAPNGPGPDRARAVDFLRAALESSADHGNAAQLLGENCQLMGDGVQAERAYRTAIAEQPGNVSALNNLAAILAKSDATRKEAISFAQRAVAGAEAMRPQPAQRKDFLETLGSALLADGQLKEAEAAFRKGLEIDPTAPDLTVGLAEALVAQGRTKDAQALVRRLDTMTSDLGHSDSSIAARAKVLKERLAAASEK